MNTIATPKSKFEKAVKKCAMSPLKKKSKKFDKTTSKYYSH